MHRKLNWCISGASRAASFRGFGATPTRESIEEKVEIARAAMARTASRSTRQFPTIWGQQQGYLYIQLRDFKRGDRKNEIMQPIAARWSAGHAGDMRIFFEEAVARSRPAPRIEGSRQPAPCAPIARSAAPAAISINFRATAPCRGWRA